MSTLIFAYAGTGAFFPIVSEMRDPNLYPRALALCQTVVTIIFLTVGIVVYYYCGSYVASPALGSAGVTIKKVSNGIAFPGLLVSGVLLAHVSHSVSLRREFSANRVRRYRANICSSAFCAIRSTSRPTHLCIGPHG